MSNEQDLCKSVEEMNVSQNSVQNQFDLKSDESISIVSNSSKSTDVSGSSEILSLPPSPLLPVDQFVQKSTSFPALKKSLSPKKTGFEQGLELKEILGIGRDRINGGLLCMVKWKGSNEVDLVPSTQINAKYPQMVIKYYEDRIEWDSNSTDSDDGDR
ncbi:chromobox protein homolog 1-like [Contarinia nasturtii]|uniref:chromobox protein homolog 1-like n=1 Tax=Contarinia nasturtii TaxID=265458 RepID=UPI0012D41329|nr:chromobox protein homolog 1-like [Contarinia nasturtii]